MPAIEEVCTITAKGQTTVPKAVRQALGVGYGGRIAFRVEGDAVTIHAVSDEPGQDEALGPFLDLLATDLAARPRDAIQPLTSEFAVRLQGLTVEIGAIDLDAPIEGDVAL